MAQASIKRLWSELANGRMNERTNEYLKTGLHKELSEKSMDGRADEP